MSISHKSTKNLNITGCAVCLFQGKDQVMICDENRVALSYAEQEQFKSKQPFLLPPETLDQQGNTMDPIQLGRLIYIRKRKIQSNDTKAIQSITKEQAMDEYNQAQLNHTQFSLTGRHFQHVVLRERSNKNEAHQDVCVRLLREEFYRSFKGSVPKYDFVYQRAVGSSALLVYLINVDETEINEDILRRKGLSNYFCAKSIPNICDNDYNETRNHRFVTIEQARTELVHFSVTYPNDVYDLNHWGALSLFDAVMKHSEKRRHSPSYTLVEQIGRGAYSVVWKATTNNNKKETNKMKVIKEMTLDAATTSVVKDATNGAAHNGATKGATKGAAHNSAATNSAGMDGTDSSSSSSSSSIPSIVAVKEMKMRNVPSGRVEVVLREIAAMQSLRGHPNIVELFGAEEHNGALLLAMELCTGGTLRDFITKNAPMTDHIELLSIVRGISSGLYALRTNNLVHRDLKPSNILFQNGVVRLADFGMSRSMRNNETDSHVCGTIRCKSNNF
tara:strand:- start:735 stop:2243 length:1509 start_codon:yes stop_codon:yes gene_type:complete